MEPSDDALQPEERTLEQAQQEVRNLHMALESRTVIGQAVGILMERYDADAEAAFAMLKRLSSERNLKVRDVAQEVTARGPIAGL